MFQVKEKKPKREKRRKKDKAAAMESAAENVESGAAAAEEDQVKKEPFLKRLLFGEPKPDLSELESGSTTILDILSPTMVDTKSRDYSKRLWFLLKPVRCALVSRNFCHDRAKCNDVYYI